MIIWFSLRLGERTNSFEVDALADEDLRADLVCEGFSGVLNLPVDVDCCLTDRDEGRGFKAGLGGLGGDVWFLDFPFEGPAFFDLEFGSCRSGSISMLSSRLIKSS